MKIFFRFLFIFVFWGVIRIGLELLLCVKEFIDLFYIKIYDIDFFVIGNRNR